MYTKDQLISIKAKHKTHKDNAIKKNVGYLTLSEYTQKMIDANIYPENIGQQQYEYQLGRYTDSGDYTVDSCRFITAAVNRREKVKNGGSKRNRGYPISRLVERSIIAYRLISPDGKLHIGENVSELARKYDIGNTSKLYEVLKGVRNSHKGWKRG